MMMILIYIQTKAVIRLLFDCFIIVNYKIKFIKISATHLLLRQIHQFYSAAISMNRMRFFISIFFDKRKEQILCWPKDRFPPARPTFEHSNANLAKYMLPFFFFFLNSNSLHARLNSHYEAWSYKIKKH